MSCLKKPGERAERRRGMSGAGCVRVAEEGQSRLNAQRRERLSDPERDEQPGNESKREWALIRDL